MTNQTTAAHWREKDEPDPHGSYYDRERAQLALGDLTDDELANAVFMHGDSKPSIAEINDGKAKMPIVYLTAAKERIRWLSRKVEESKRIEQSMAEVLRDARKYITALGKPECEICKVQMVVAQIDAIIAGQVQAQHPDDVAVDNFAKAMKDKLAKARAKGRGGWDDPSSCSVEHLSELLIGHIGKGNPGNFEDIANLAMMLHQRGADPALLASKQPSPVVMGDYFSSLVAMARISADKAMRKFPQPNYVLLKVAEEAGEVVQAGVHYAENRMKWTQVEGEIVQLLAMLIRLVTEGDQVNGITPPSSCLEVLPTPLSRPEVGEA